MMADLFPDEVIRLLRGAMRDPEAKRTYDMMSDGFWWSDEMLPEMVALCRANNSWAFRCLLGFRGSLIRGKPDEQLRPPWDQLLRECPDWPGFQPDRRDPELLALLERSGRRAMLSFERADRDYHERND